jgi:mRNA interferase RelE/StbE
MARMKYKVLFAPQAIGDYKRLSARHRAEVRDAIERHLRYQPTRLSKSRIKKLRGLARPQYRLRIGEIRIFYDVKEDTIEVLAIIYKLDASRWLADEGKQS